MAIRMLTAVAVFVGALAAPAVAAPGGEGRILVDAARPGTWQSDGLWRIEPRQDGVELLKDERPMHNSMCWTVLPQPLKRGETLEIVYRMQVPNKHVDLVLGEKCGRPDPTAPLPEFAEVVSLGGIPSTGWETRRLTITSARTVDTLGFLSWGWPVDRGTWMRVASIRVLPPADAGEWIVWRVPPHLNPKSIPARSPLQDFFPFGIYLPMEFRSHFKHEGLKDGWEWLDRVLADVKARGMNFISVTNLVAADLDRLAALCEKHGLRMNPQVGEFNIKWQNDAKAFIRAVAKYRGRPVIAGWAVGEEFDPDQVPRLDVPHEIVHAVDPANTLVTIHNNTEAFHRVGELLDARICFRDIYPFFDYAPCGPTTHEASMNYYEDEIDKNQRLLPKGASLWVMPQAHEEHNLIDGKWVRVFRMPTPAEIRLQTWAALGRGAQGIAYFLYPSAAPRKPGDPQPFRALRTLDGKPTPELEALTDLARKLVPLGPVITRWERSRLPAATDRRELRAYLFRGGDGTPYAVVFNHGVRERIEGRVRLPFACPEVKDLLSGASLKPVKDGQATLLSLALPAGDGTILRLSGKMPEPAEQEEGTDLPRVSSRPRPDLPLADLPDGRRLFRYQLDLRKTEGVPEGDSLSKGLGFRDWPSLGQKHMNGAYGGDVTFEFEMPAPIASLSAAGRFANHADGAERAYSVLYSLDGKAFTPLAEKRFGSGESEEVGGEAGLPAGTRRVWVTFRLPMRNPAIVLKELDVRLTLAGKP